MIFFVLAVLVGSLAYMIVGKARLAIRVSLAAAVFLAVGVGYLLFPQVVLRGPGQVWYERSPTKQAIGLGLMVLGMAAKYLFDAIARRKEKIKAGEKNAGLEFDRWDFVQPFIVSVMVFGAFWSSHGEEAMSVEYLTLAFQSGFFWQTVLDPPSASKPKTAVDGGSGKEATQVAGGLPSHADPTTG